MKVVILSLALFCSAVTASAAAACSADDGLLPNPNDCGSYFLCDNGNLVQQPCPPGLFFNPEISVCDHPQNVDCQASDAPPTGTPTTVKPTTPGTSPTEASTTTTVEPTEEPTDEPTEEPTEEPTDAPSTTEDPTDDPSSTDKSTTSTTRKPTTTTTRKPTTTTTRKPTTTTTSKPSTSTTSTPSTSTSAPSTSTTSKPPTNSTEKPSTSTTSAPSTSTTAKPPTNSTQEPPTSTTAEPSNSTSTSAPSTSTTAQPPTNSTQEPPTSTTSAPSNSTSTSAPSTSTTAKPPTNSTEPSTTTPEDGSTTQSPDDSTTPEEPSYKPDCPEEGYAILENPESCSSFFVCVNGNSGLISCADGFDFNPETVKCDLPADPLCRVGSTEEPSTTPDPYVPPCPETGTVQVANPSDCGSFYICINGLYAKLSCPGNFEFNETLQSCVYPDLSTCNVAEVYSVQAFQCTEDGTFPDPEDCESYYVCTGNQLFQLQCPGGLHFDAALGTCNTPDAAQCEIVSTGSPSTSTTNSPSSSTSTTSKPTTASTTSPTTSRPTTNPPASSTSTRAPSTTQGPTEPNCPNSGTQILPDPEDCTRFIVCIEGDYGVIQCPPEYAFSEELESCAPASEVTCNVSSSTPPPFVPECPSTGTGKLPNPDDCGSYYFCVNGNAALINCPSGLNFDKESGTCSAGADCSSQTSAPTSSSTSPQPTSSTAKPTSTTAKPSSSSTTGAPTSTDLPTSSQKPTSGPAECETNGEVLPNPASCTSFLQCVNGELIQLDCPPGLEFNAELSVCDHPESANCSIKPSKSLLQFLQFWN